MKILLVLSAVAVAALAAPQGYSLPTPTGSGLLTASGVAGDLGQSTESLTDSLIISGSEQPTDVSILKETFSEGEASVAEGHLTIDADSDATPAVQEECKEGEVRHIDGSCVVPVISRKVFVFTVPQQELPADAPLPDLPAPKVEHNILFVRLPEAGEGPEPIIVPPPRQNNIVYVLNKQTEQGPRVIEVPAPPPSEPEIYFIDYEEGENPTLPSGVDLQTALGSASETEGEYVGADGHLASSTSDDAQAEESVNEDLGNVIFETGPSDLEFNGSISPQEVPSSSSDFDDAQGVDITSGLYTSP